MNHYEYTPTGVCSKKIIIDVEDNIIKNIEVIGGCSGNLQGIAALCKDEAIDTVISKLQGIKCGFRSTSCPDQITKALEQYKKETN